MRCRLITGSLIVTLDHCSFAIFLDNFFLLLVLTSDCWASVEYSCTDCRLSPTSDTSTQRFEPRLEFRRRLYQTLLPASNSMWTERLSHSSP
ncbi:hypothetical protein C8R41DRAFT_837887 [Lentinula lateritia]|uniref:Secreted protein n=1 Tax=Lentinula lateritia TaxID=40482 RepID=A0ABQ8VEJ7_9AGAR|nr:hypothetical protein C8R41DRAFT_837887 [Lentinula lateritia]